MRKSWQIGSSQTARAENPAAVVREDSLEKVVLELGTVGKSESSTTIRGEDLGRVITGTKV